MTVASDSRFVALVPAAGQGKRFGAPQPKQYEPVHGRPLIAYTIEALLGEPWIDSVHIVVAVDDQMPQTDPALLAISDSRVHWHPVGGPSRQASVAAGLAQLEMADNTWVMVHDAARPGVSGAALRALRQAIENGAPGALLALPVADTVKRATPETERVAGTLSRDHLWLAQTPQVFGLAQLRQALAQAESVTDESSAMEQFGVHAQLVRGEWRNQKITTPDDMQMWLAGRAVMDQATDE